MSYMVRKWQWGVLCYCRRSNLFLVNERKCVINIARVDICTNCLTIDRDWVGKAQTSVLVKNKSV